MQKNRTAKIICQKEGQLHSVTEITILEPPKVVTQPKKISILPIIQNPTLPEKSGETCKSFSSCNKLTAKQVILQITSDHVKQFPHTKYASTRPKPKIKCRM